MRKGKELLPLLPLRGVLIFPNMVLHLDVGRERSVKALDEAMVGDNRILLVAQKDAKVDEPAETDLYAVGTVALIKQMIKLPGGMIRVLVEGLSRAAIIRYLHIEPFFKVEAELIEEEAGKTAEVEALRRSLLYQFEHFIKASRKIPPETLATVSGIEDPGRLADVITSHLNLKIRQKQELLEAVSAKERLEKLSELLNREMEIVELERRINLRVRKQMEKTQKEYYLREQMKAIQKELGEKDERTAEADEYREKIEKAELPPEVEEKALEEVDRLEKMPPAAAEGIVIRTYLDWLLELPWSKVTEDRLDLDRAAEILDEDHYGLDKVKERIIEYLAVRRLAEKLKGPILCLIGPPGVGKTSLARSIARALERNFVRISLGGVRDEAEIRGHRRTYVGALPGRIIQGMRQAKSKNPVFLMDEVDKMSTDFRGDPSSALLEVLDPEQNHAFSDHYIELPFDLSQVMFITTANSPHNIPQPLLDRMEAIYLPGYTEEDKVEIARRHLIPKQISEHGLTADNLTLSEGAVRAIIRSYTREAGVRNLERSLAAICRKVAREVVKDRNTRVSLSRKGLQKYLGIPRFRYGTGEKENEVGVATGLAWTEVGGDLLSIEVTPLKGKGKVILTGKLGEVMQESAQAALSYVRSRAEELGLDEDFYEETDIHIHVPEGAIPKDGPSAGIAMATALVSALTRIPVRRDVTLTGEITLRGRVLPVGGIKEKMLAAHRAGIRYMLMPVENRKDLSDIPANVRRRVEVKLVEHMDEVLDLALLEKPRKKKRLFQSAAESEKPLAPVCTDEPELQRRDDPALRH
ncbi:MAG TPA: endopeptidase La [Bacillota bacterium]|jgi:ATP-dependent Lon protease|nr:endopeptidase La [Bacillota bacterium]HOA35948.1 endopeptidase La [Bacillota bacterium]HOJ83374.1 endopeptidase La [Bacillota bacterium]HOL15179.1 endopeptidase La [Bacillota bacterium]HPZ12298.1 endopeptidase La [Bacillota bacterium]